MILKNDELKALIHGAVRVETDENGMLCPHRFTEEQVEAYRLYSDDFYKKTSASAGIRLEFKTNSSTLSLEGVCFFGSSSRKFAGFDVYSNGYMCAHALFEKDDSAEIPFKIDAKLFGNGEKNVTVYLPWSAQAKLSSLTLDDDAKVSELIRPYKMMCFGDSITHGYDSHNPSFSYASRLCDTLCADHVNKGIGGEVFFPTLARLKDDIEPDIITVAYGTNDWSKTKKERFDKNSKEFYEELSKNYPNAKIFALTPIWRSNYLSNEKDIKDFFHVRDHIKEIADGLDNVTVIDCFDFVPKEASCFSADLLHPNDEGFRHYAAALYTEIKKYL